MSERGPLNNCDSWGYQVPNGPLPDNEAAALQRFEPFMVFCGPFAEAWFEFIAVHDAAVRKAALTEAADAIRADAKRYDAKVWNDWNGEIIYPANLRYAARVVERLIGGEE